MKKIELTKGKFTLVDDEDYDFLMRWKWQYMNVGYAGRSKYAGMKNGKEFNECLYIHRLVTNAEKGFEVDHIDHDKLNNQKKNLRVVTSSQNKMNGNSRVGSTSKYKGVSWDAKNNKWQAGIHYEGKKVFLGRFNSEDDAAEAYNKKAGEVFGEYARYNEVNNA